MEESHPAKGACLRVNCRQAQTNKRTKDLRARMLACLHSGQSSLEYLLVVALTFAIIVPATYLFYNYSKESTEGLVDAQVTQLGTSIVDAAESIFYSGKGSKTVLELNVPNNIESALIVDGRELIFNITTGFGVSEIVFFSSVNITSLSEYCDANICRIPELASSGLKKVKIEAISKDSVRIEVV